MRLSEVNEEEGKIIEEIMTVNSLKLIKNINLHIQEPNEL